MLVWIRRLVPLAIIACLGLTAYVAFGKAPQHGSLTGTWSGYIAGKPGSEATRQHMRIVVNARQTGGSWKISATCHGPLTLDEHLQRLPPLPPEAGARCDLRRR